MDIRELMRKMNAYPEGKQTDAMEKEIIRQFESLPDEEKEKVRHEFMASLDDKLKETKERLDDIDISIDMLEISKYVSLSRIASDYFGKSKEWLYQRIKGYTINGKPARFTPEERKRLSSALEDISRIIHNTARKIA